MYCRTKLVTVLSCFCGEILPRHDLSELPFSLVVAFRVNLPALELQQLPLRAVKTKVGLVGIIELAQISC